MLSWLSSLESLTPSQLGVVEIEWFLSSTGKGHTMAAKGCGSHSVPVLWTPKLKLSQDLPEFHSSHFKELKPKREKLETLKINFQSVE